MSFLLQHVFIKCLFGVDTVLGDELQLGNKIDRAWSSPDNSYSLSRE